MTMFSLCHSFSVSAHHNSKYYGQHNCDCHCCPCNYQPNHPIVLEIHHFANGELRFKGGSDKGGSRKPTSSFKSKHALTICGVQRRHLLDLFLSTSGK